MTKQDGDLVALVERISTLRSRIGDREWTIESVYEQGRVDAHPVTFVSSGVSMAATKFICETYNHWPELSAALRTPAPAQQSAERGTDETHALEDIETLVQDELVISRNANASLRTSLAGALAFGEQQEDRAEAADSRIEALEKALGEFVRIDDEDISGLMADNGCDVVLALEAARSALSPKAGGSHA